MMPERWTYELRRIEELHPDDDLVERAMARPRRPAPPPRPSTRIATIVIALALPLALILGAFAILRDHGSNIPLGEGPGGAAPTNGDLAYAKRVNDGWSLFAIDPTTGVERQITQGYRDYGSDWSPDGTRIAYDSESPNGDQGIWVVNADGSGATKLVDGGSVPAWSPDGSTIAFARPDLAKTVSYGNGSSGTPFYIYVMNADGTNVRRLTQGELSDYFPSWSPDGNQIAFFRTSSSGGGGLYVMNADGSDQRRIAPDLEIFGRPAWSPDGGSIGIAVNGVQGGKPGGIMLVPADGTAPPAMVPGTEATYPDHVGNPAWSPDGRWVAYVEGYPGTIVLVHPDGTGRRELEVNPGTDSIEALSWGTAPQSEPSNSSP